MVTHRSIDPKTVNLEKKCFHSEPERRCSGFQRTEAHLLRATDSLKESPRPEIHSKFLLHRKVGPQRTTVKCGWRHQPGCREQLHRTARRTRFWPRVVRLLLQNYAVSALGSIRFKSKGSFRRSHPHTLICTELIHLPQKGTRLS